LDADTPHFVHAFEDLPDEIRSQAAEIAGSGVSLRRRIMDSLETAVLDSYGALEQVPLLHFLSRYPVTSYTYQVSDLVSRGQRPNAGKLLQLADRVSITINLCAEMTDGDRPAIAEAGLTATMRTHHIPVTDMETPTIAQLAEILDLLSGPDAERTYLHCEAGRGRTGVATACYRMAVAGWGANDALTEAVNFGCCIPKQQGFIREFGEMLQTGSIRGKYPLRPVGSVSPSPAQLAATIHTAAEPKPHDWEAQLRHWLAKA
jgi:Cyclin-dependent kinase inhibitor 3 (CDKN3)